MSYANWNGNIGTKIGSGMTDNDILKASNLNWQVKTSPLTFGTFGEFKDENKRAAYRADTGTLLDIYGSDRRPFQNADMLKMMRDFVSVAGLELSEIGSIGGHSIWVSADLPVQYDWNIREKGDITKSKLVVKDSHLNNHGLEVFLWSDRLWCRNGQTEKVNSKVAVISHTNGVDVRTAQTVLAGALCGLKLKEGIMNRLAETTMSIEECTMLLIDRFGDPDKSVSDQPDIVQKCMKLFRGEGIASSEITTFNTAYGALQAVTEYFSHHAKTDSQESRFASMLSGKYAAKSRDFERQLVKVYC